MSFSYFYSDPSTRTNLTSVTYNGGDTNTRLPSTVVTIAANAFATATVQPAITSIDCSDAANLRTIGNDGFRFCTVLTSITGINSVTSIGTTAFYYSSLKSFLVPPGVKFIPRQAFLASSLTSFTIPSSVTGISESIFLSCSQLTSVIFQGSIGAILQETFANCTNLREFIFPSSITNIGYRSFFNCSALKKIIIPRSVVTIESFAFQTCSGLTSITIEKVTTPLTELGASSFFSVPLSINNTYPNYCSLIGMLLQGYLPETLTSAGFNAAAITAAVNNNKFTYGYSDINTLTNLTSVTYAGTGISTATLLFSVTSIAANAFSNVTSSLTGIDFVLTSSVLSIGTSAFSGCTLCTSISSITNMSSVTTIGSSAFQNCLSLRQIIVPNSTTSIGASAFQGCSGLTSIKIQKVTSPLTALGLNSFLNTTGINNTYPNYCSVLGMLLQGYNQTDLVTNAGFGSDAYNAAADNNKFTYSYSDVNKTVITGASFSSGISTATLLFSVTSIAASAFSSVTSSLTCIDCILTTSLSSIGSSAFSGCSLFSSISSITNISSVTNIGTSAFQSTKLTTFPWPTGTKLINDNTFNSCTSLSTITNISLVTNIGTSAFQSCSALTLITIPNTVTSIGTSAFQSSGLITIAWLTGIKFINDNMFNSCTSLSSITNIASVTNIGTSAFQSCSGLRKIIVPTSVTNIGSSAFQNCSGLTSITIQKLTSILPTLGSNSFFGTTGINNTYPNYCSLIGMLLQGYNQTDLVTNAGFRSDAYNAADANNKFTYGYSDPNTQTNLTSVTYAGSGISTATLLFSITSIAANAFSNATTSLRGIDFILTTSLSSIGNSAFDGCSLFSSISNITNIESVTSIGTSAFRSTALRTFTWPTQTKLINNNTFNSCTSLSSITNISLVTSIGTSAFQSCSALTLITIPNTVTSIGTSAFQSSGLITIAWLTGIKFINDNMFNSCTSLSSITNIESVTKIGTSAFQSCSALTLITIPNTVTNIGTSAFQSSGLITIAWPTETKLIDNNAFNSCSSLSSITNISLVTNIGTSAFQSCSALTLITIPNTVTSIGTSAFQSSGLITIAWLTGIKFINDNMFNSCTSLSSITNIASVTNIGTSAFQSCSGLRKIIVPTSVTNIGSSAFQNCSGLTSITIQKLTSILPTLGSNSFFGTTGINNTYPNYCSLIGMLLQGYNQTDLVTNAGFSEDAYNAADANNKFTYGYSDPNTQTNLTSVTYASSGISTATLLFSITSIATNAFSNATSSLTGIDFILTTSLSNIGNSAFDGCLLFSSISNITNIASVTSIGTDAFRYTALRTFTWPTQTKLINNNTFNSCTSLSSITNIESVTSIGIAAFHRCAFKYLSWLPTGINIIRDSTFSYNSNLTSIIIPSSVDTIDTLAFDNCTALTNITLPYYSKSSLVTLGENSFSNTSDININNYNALTKMIMFGYTADQLKSGVQTASISSFSSLEGEGVTSFSSSAGGGAGFNSAAVDAAVESSCFNEDTKILCFKNNDELYIPIQNLRKGDFVKTYLHGYKQIDLIGKADLRNKLTNKWTNNMFIMYKTPENDLTEDLIMTGGHSILVDHFTKDEFIEERQKYYNILTNNPWTIDDKHLLPVGTLKAFHEIQDEKIYTYYNFSLENNGDNDKRYGVWANGILVETPSKKQFESFKGYELYPDNE